MEKSTFEQMGGTYYQQGDYFLPNFSVPESAPVGIWGVQHQRLDIHYNTIGLRCAPSPEEMEKLFQEYLAGQRKKTA